MSVAHDALVEYECGPGWGRRHERPVQCKVGAIVPGAPECLEMEAGPRAEPANYRLMNEQPRFVSSVKSDLRGFQSLSCVSLLQSLHKSLAELRIVLTRRTPSCFRHLINPRPATLPR